MLNQTMQPATRASLQQPLIQIEDLSIGFDSKNGDIKAVLRNVNLEVRAGDAIGLVGESGSGKSTLALAAMGYLKRGLRVLNGQSCFNTLNLFDLSRQELESIRGGRIALIPQNSGQSLTPGQRIGAQITEALQLHTELAANACEQRTIELLTQVRLPDPQKLISRYPHELSGGQQQRVAIAMALAGEPEVLLLDEPTTGLDVTTQAHILALLRDIATESEMAMVYVSHDLGAIAQVCHQVAVMYAGEVVLQGEVRQVLREPLHPYARGLLASIPRLQTAALPRALDGRPPAPGEVNNACAFVNRCILAKPACSRQRPDLQRVASGELVRCPCHEEALTIPVTTDQERPCRSIDQTSTPVLALNDLAITYHKPGLLQSWLGQKGSNTPTVDDINLSLKAGETLGLVGESGSGKSTILKTVAGLLPPLCGDMRWQNSAVLTEKVEHRDVQQLRKVQIIFQNPDESLNPRQTISEVLAQPLKLYFGLSGKALEARSMELLERVRLGAHYMSRYPAQLSGGEKQRVAIARAFAAEPELVLCDEVTSALDVSVQAAVLDLLDDLRREKNTAYIFVSHDLAVVRALSDRVAVLYQGRLCEIGSAASVYAAPSHPYTEVLLDAVLEPDPDSLPSLIANDAVELSPPEHGCPFQRRCPKSLGEICDNTSPPWQQLANGHTIRCHLELSSVTDNNKLKSAPA